MIRHSIRLLYILFYILPFALDRQNGKKLALALEKLGPAFVKLGQVASTRSDVIGEALADDLSRLRDALPAFSGSLAKQIVEKELNAPIAELFHTFDEKPVAAASIAQVHRATTKDGKDVAVKILRPGIENAFSRDVELFFWLADIAENRLHRCKRLKPLQIVKTLQETVFFELDLRLEAAAAAELSTNTKRHNVGFRVPSVYWNLTSKRVLVMEWVDGIPLADVRAIRDFGFSPDALLEKAAKSLFAQVFQDGFFHADLHPGNLFVDGNGDLVAVDFGIMGRLDMRSRIYMAEILRGFLNEDYRHVAETHFAAGYVPAGKSREAFTQACMGVAKPITGRPLNEISVAKLLGQMFSIAAQFEMETQPQLLLLQKTMMVTEGVGRMLNPNLNMWELARPMIETWAGEQFGASAKLKEAARQGKEHLEKLPVVLGYIEGSLRNLSEPNGIKLHPDTIRALSQQRRRYHWLNLMLIGVMLLALWRWW